ncbi:PP-loop domain protein [Methanococcus vannielii SB]|jgi:uncharacterized protein (TIGR00269 family)|uniref:PP-loop domain protein n=1 Tax=Methanococcus vannielii (strain ATCC 35089 / DSM 1224 / JCM 13029 / OCM 148 / SB) TaxID=406327 RepID=A6UNK8_METVS|nr:TIGR00269 family protein [Methanococcus vannielii]ABR54080.1 PP-loop domain protein [Methanococcus vannielii SB]ABR54572.1 PP-loop domain protein [Methanococcus vannielii SB]
MECKKCKSPSIYHQKHSGKHFCKECFINDITKKVRKTLGRNIIKNNVKIGIGLSGGKDSLVMAHLLSEFFKPIPNAKLIGLMVDEGIDGFRTDGINNAIDFCNEYDIEYKVVHFKDYIETDLDTIVKLAKEKNLTMNPCSFCGVIRRKILNKIAIIEKCDYLAIGHNLDDISQAVMMNYIEGNIKKLAVLGKDSKNSKFVKRIKPLEKIPEDEVLLFADFLKLKYHKAPCPYSSLSYRSEISEITDQLEENHPGAKYSIVKGFERLLEYLNVPEEVGVCKICGDASSRDICKVCTYLKELEILEKSKF